MARPNERRARAMSGEPGHPATAKSRPTRGITLAGAAGWAFRFILRRAVELGANGAIALMLMDAYAAWRAPAPFGVDLHVLNASDETVRLVETKYGWERLHGQVIELEPGAWWLRCQPHPTSNRVSLDLLRAGATYSESFTLAPEQSRGTIDVSAAIRRADVAVTRGADGKLGSRARSGCTGGRLYGPPGGTRLPDHP